MTICNIIFVLLIKPHLHQLFVPAGRDDKINYADSIFGEKVLYLKFISNIEPGSRLDK